MEAEPKTPCIAVLLSEASGMGGPSRRFLRLGPMVPLQDLLLSDSKSDDRLEVRQSRETLNEDEEWPSPFGSMRAPPPKTT